MIIEPDVADIRSEDRLLLCCAQTTMDEQKIRLVNNLIHQNLDWSYLVRRAAYHRIVPPLYRNLSQASLNGVPPMVLNELHQHYATIAKRNLFLTAKLLQLIDLFITHSITAIPYKGPALAFLAYGNVCLRQFNDLDILTDPRDYLKTQYLLLERGYRLTADHGWECSLTDDSQGVYIDLHKGLTPEQFPTHLDMPSLQQRLESLPVAGGRINTFCPEDMLIILCIQLAKDARGNPPLRLTKICDIAELLRARPDIQWDRVLTESKGMGCQRMLLVSLAVTHKILDIPIPELILKLFNPRLDILITHVYHKLIHQSTDGYTAQLTTKKFHFKIRERWRDKLYPQYHDLKQHLSPNELDRALLPLPELLNFLYYLIRPMRLLRDYGRRGWQTLKARFLSWERRR